MVRCPLCSRPFYYPNDLDDHIEEDHYNCSPCKRAFANAEAMHRHNQQVHFYCSPCRRLFQSQQNLDAHLNSSLHKPKNFRCPMQGCNQTFVSVAAVVLHLEAGKCASGITRAIIDKYIIQNDRNNIITNPRRMIAGGSTQEYTTPPTYMATERSWNGTAYECYFCHREFGALRALNAHLASPRHTSPDQKIYRCPNRDCGQQLTTLSGLCQHIESGKCGVNKFSGVQDTMDQFVNGMKRLAFLIFRCHIEYRR